MLLIIIIFFIIGGTVGLRMLPEHSLEKTKEKIEALNPLQIKHIIIRGRQLTDENDILTSLGTHINHSLFSFSIEEARSHIDALPFIEHSTIERHLPDTVIITVVERTPIAIWQTQKKFILINEKGERVSNQPIGIKDIKIFQKFLLVVGQGANTEAAAIINLINQYPDIKDRTLALIRIGGRRWNVLLRNGITLLLPEGVESSALERLNTYQTQFHLFERPIETIDMRLPDRMVIHPASPDKIVP